MGSAEGWVALGQAVRYGHAMNLGWRRAAAGWMFAVLAVAVTLSSAGFDRSALANGDAAPVGYTTVSHAPGVRTQALHLHAADRIPEAGCAGAHSHAPLGAVEQGCVAARLPQTAMAAPAVAVTVGGRAAESPDPRPPRASLL